MNDKLIPNAGEGIKRRYEFSGVENDSSGYIGKSVRSYYGKSQNPVKYINM